MAEMSQRFPFVEWGILFSQSKKGPRYPSLDWVELLKKQAAITPMNLAAHLCGKWVEYFVEFGYSVPDFGAGSRRQFNLAGSRLSTVLERPEVQERFRHSDGVQTILGGPYGANLISCFPAFLTGGDPAPLFDASGGRGIESKSWLPIPRTEAGPIWCGYAGGLGPDNIQEELKRIEEVVEDGTIWIDMETKVRNSSDRFDLPRCEKVLENVLPYVTC